MRKVNNKIVILKSIFYRILVLVTQIIFTWIFLKDIKLAFSISIGWNCLNTVEYYMFEYLFSKKWDTTVQTEGVVIWLTGLPCSGKSTIGDKLAQELKQLGKNVERLDGDIVRNGKLSDDLGFSKGDRDKNINRINFVSKLLSRNDTIVIASFVSPYKRTRDNIRKSVTNFVEIYVKASPKVCAIRDVKGMWAKARKGEIKGFTGYDDPYEEPNNPEVICNTEFETVVETTNKITEFLKERNLI